MTKTTPGFDVWVRFTDRFDYKPNAGTCVVYKPGTYNVPSACATLAVAAGKAVRLRKRHKDEEAVEWPSEPLPASSESA